MKAANIIPKPTRIVLSLSFAVLVFLSVLLAIGKILNYRLGNFTSDLYVNLEVAKNVFDLGRFLYSSIGGNFLGIHLYLLNPLEAIPVAFMGGLYYMVVCGLVLFGASIALYRCCSLVSQSQTLAICIAAAFTFSPLTWSVIQMPVYGFEYDIYAILFLPLLVWAVLEADRWLLLAVLVLTLMVKEEIGMSVLLIGAYFALWKPYRLRGICIAVTGLAYVLLALMVLSRHFDEAFTHPSLEVRARLMKPEVIVASVKAMISADNNLFFALAKACQRYTGTVIYPLLVLSAFPTFPLTVFTSILVEQGFTGGEFFFWKIPYIMMLAWIFFGINIGRLLNLVGKARPILCLGLVVLAGWSACFWYSTWYTQNPLYQVQNAWRYSAKSVASVDGPSMVAPTEYAERVRDVKEIETLNAGRGILMPRYSNESPIGEFAKIHYSLLPGENVVLVDRKRQFVDGLTKSIATFTHLPKVFESANFVVLALSNGSSGLPPIDVGRSVESGSISFEIDIADAGLFVLEAAYSRARKADTPIAYQPVRWEVDGVGQTTPTMQVTTIGLDEQNASRVSCGLVNLSQGRHRVRFVRDRELDIYHLYAMRLVSKGG